MGHTVLYKEHNGQIFVKKSIPDEGTEIEIILPGLIEEKREVKKEPISDYEGSAKVIWVDDELINRKVAIAMLQKLGHQGDTAESGQEALAYLDKNEYDLVITDIGMPGMSG
ncbi:response regulator, partial [Candidatus Riflebacteria bacterium]